MSSQKTKFRSVRTNSFKKNFNKLPAQIQELAHKDYKLFRENPRHPLLQIEPIKSRTGHFEVRITKDYHATFKVERDENSIVVYIWYWIGTHNEFDKMN